LGSSRYLDYYTRISLIVKRNTGFTNFNFQLTRSKDWFDFRLAKVPIGLEYDKTSIEHKDIFTRRVNMVEIEFSYIGDSPEDVERFPPAHR
jgi:hypothetical protein